MKNFIHWQLPLYFIQRLAVHVLEQPTCKCRPIIGVRNVQEERRARRSSGLAWVYCVMPKDVHVAQWAKRPPLKLDVPGSSPHRWFNGRAGNRDPFRWLETARGLEPIRLIGRAQYFPGGLAASSLKRVSISYPFAVSAKKDSFFSHSSGDGDGGLIYRMGR